MIRSCIFALALTASLGLALPSYAQVTDQTDQSEEDWRQSRKKSGTSDIYRTPNTNTTGSVQVTPLTPVERLPSDSRRHLMRERAKAIAESDDGDISDAEYVPSDAAQSDEALMREEKEAWDIIVTDAKGDAGQGTSQGGPNKVAVSGQGSGTATSGSRGGSTRTLQEIMDAIKNGQTGGGSGQSESGDATSGSQTSQAGQGNNAGEGQGEGQNNEQGTSESDTSDGTGDADGADSQSGSDGSSSGEAGDGDGTDAGDTGATASRTQEPMSPLERIRRSREDGPADGTKRSASDYIDKTDN